jgi:hypothetical protein
MRHALEVQAADLRDVLAQLARLLVFLEQAIGLNICALELLEFYAQFSAVDGVAIELGASPLPSLERSATFLQKVFVIRADCSLGRNRCRHGDPFSATPRIVYQEHPIRHTGEYRFWSSYRSIVPLIPLPLVRKICTQCISFGNSYLLLHRFLFAS